MKKILLIALSSIILVPRAVFGMGAPGMSIAENPGALALQQQTATTLATLAEKGKELFSSGPTKSLSSFSCPIPEKYRVPLAAVSGFAIAAGCVTAYTSAQARTRQEMAIAEALVRSEAERKKQKEIKAKLTQVHREFDPLITNREFAQTYGGVGFNGWFNAQQRYIVKLIGSAESRNQALNKHGVLAITDSFKFFGYRPYSGSHDFYLFTLDTPKSAQVAYEAQQAQTGPSQPAQSEPATPLEGQVLEAATQTLNPPLVLTFKKITDTDPGYTTTEFDNLKFRVSNSEQSPYIIEIYEELVPEAPKPGWFAGWFAKSKTTPAVTTTTPITPEPSSSGGLVATPPSEAATSGTSTPPTPPASSSSSITIRNISTGAEQPQAKPWYKFW
jgi:hypothetical protein